MSETNGNGAHALDLSPCEERALRALLLSDVPHALRQQTATNLFLLTCIAVLAVHAIILTRKVS